MTKAAANFGNGFDIRLIGFLNEIAGQKIGQYTASDQNDHCNKADQTEQWMQHEQHAKEDWRPGSIEWRVDRR